MPPWTGRSVTTSRIPSRSTWPPSTCWTRSTSSIPALLGMPSRQTWIHCKKQAVPSTPASATSFRTALVETGNSHAHLTQQQQARQPHTVLPALCLPSASKAQLNPYGEVAARQLHLILNKRRVLARFDIEQVVTTQIQGVTGCLVLTGIGQAGIEHVVPGGFGLVLGNVCLTHDTKQVKAAIELVGKRMLHPQP